MLKKYLHPTAAAKYFAKENRRTPTPSEKLLWQRLRCKRMCGVRFHRQKPILNYIADFYCPKARVVVEVDGVGHDPIRDRMRDEAFARRNILTLRFTNQQLERNEQEVLAAIRETVNHRCATKPTATGERSFAEITSVT